MYTKKSSQGCTTEDGPAQEAAGRSLWHRRALHWLRPGAPTDSHGASSGSSAASTAAFDEAQSSLPSSEAVAQVLSHCGSAQHAPKQQRACVADALYTQANDHSALLSKVEVCGNVRR